MAAAINTFQTLVGATTAVTVASNTSTRLRATLVNRQPVPVWIGGSSVASNSGLRLDPGASLMLETNATIYGAAAATYVPTGSLLVHVVEELSS